MSELRGSPQHVLHAKPPFPTQPAASSSSKPSVYVTITIVVPEKLYRKGAGS